VGGDAAETVITAIAGPFAINAAPLAAGGTSIQPRFVSRRATAANGQLIAK
jgi:hypothetical protein